MVTGHGLMRDAYGGWGGEESSCLLSSGVAGAFGAGGWE